MALGSVARSAGSSGVDLQPRRSNGARLRDHSRHGHRRAQGAIRQRCLHPMAAQVVLGEAVACGRALGFQLRHHWDDIRLKVRAPVDEPTRVIQSQDGFDPREEKAATPRLLAGIFPSWFETDEAVQRASLEFYLNLAPKYGGSPMLSALYNVWAAWLGDRRRSLELFQEGYGRSSRIAFCRPMSTDSMSCLSRLVPVRLLRTSAGSC
jgi:hypothetical protein